MNGGPAFPRAGKEWGDKAWTEAMAEDGMTLRDYFAAKAMSSGLVNATLPPEHWPKVLPLIADFSYKMADAMLKARGQ
jgi:hypothetical protein